MDRLHATSVPRLTTVSSVNVCECLEGVKCRVLRVVRREVLLFVYVYTHIHTLRLEESRLGRKAAKEPSSISGLPQMACEVSQ